VSCCACELLRTVHHGLHNAFQRGHKSLELGALARDTPETLSLEFAGKGTWCKALVSPLDGIVQAILYGAQQLKLACSAS
jgi:hypothetical protein